MSERSDSSKTESAVLFVEEALIPFLRMCRGVKSPTVIDVGGLLWGYQAALGMEVSALDVADVLRVKIADLERSEMTNPRVINQLIDALRIADETLPEVAARFWYTAPDDSQY